MMDIKLDQLDQLDLEVSEDGRVNGRDTATVLTVRTTTGVDSC